MKKVALIIIDMLNDFVRKGAPLEVPATRGIITPIKQLLTKMRKKHLPVIFICDQHKRDDIEFRRMGWPPHAIKDTEGAKIIKELKPHPNEIIIPKTTYSGFYNTRLEETLRELNVTHLIVTGCVTHICILFTVADAVMRSFYVYVPKDCVAGLTPESHAFALKLMQDVLAVEIKESSKELII